MFPLRSFSWFKRSAASRCCRYRPWLEALEGRDAPAVYNIPNGVLSMAPVMTSTGVFTAGLADAITASNTNNQANTINLAASGTYTCSTILGANNTALPVITLNGSSANSLTINGNGATIQAGATGFRLFDISTGVLLANNLTLANATGANGNGGGAMLVGQNGPQGTVTLTSVTFQNNNSKGANGGALYLYGPATSATLVNCTITGNHSSGNGGGISVGGYATGTVGSTLSLTGCTLSNNSAGNLGGGIYVPGNAATIQITNSTLSGNTANSNGGALYAHGTRDSESFTGCTISNNTSGGDAGALALTGNSQLLTIANSVVSGNSTTQSNPFSVGGIYLTGTGAQGTLTNSIFDSNKGPYHGALLLNGSTTSAVTVTGCTFSNNQATVNGFGGAIADRFATAAQLTILNSTFSGNTVARTSKGGEGGALYVYGVPTGEAVTIQDSTFTNNSAPAANGVGGAIWFREGNPGSLTITNSIVSGNSAASSPDLYLFAGSVTNITFSLIGNATNLGALANNGGLMVGAPGSLLPLQTVALLSGSNAIDTGSNAAVPAGLTTDERGTGFNRIIDSIVDIGAYEFQQPATTSSVTSSLNPSSSGQSVTFTATVTVNAAGSNAIQGSVSFLDGTSTLATVTLTNGSASFSTSALSAGTHTITAQYNGFTLGNYTFSVSSASLTQTVNGTPIPPPAANGFFAVGADAGGGPSVVVYNAATGAVVASFDAFSPSFTGGVRVAVDDVNGDGTADIICAAGPGGGPQVIVIDGTKLSLIGTNGQIINNSLLASFDAFAPTFTGGVFVAADVSRSGQNWLAFAAGSGGGPQVVVYTAKAILAANASGTSPTPLASFYAFAPSFTGGLTLALGDVNGDGKLDVIAGAGPGGGPQVVVVDGTQFSSIPSTGILPSGALLASFEAFSPNFTGGVYVSGGATAGGGFNIIVGAGAGGGPQVVVVDGSKLDLVGTNTQIINTALLGSFFAFNPSFTGGVRVAFNGNVEGGGPTILTGAGPSGGPQLALFNAGTFQETSSFFALPQGFNGGLFVAG